MFIDKREIHLVFRYTMLTSNQQHMKSKHLSSPQEKFASFQGQYVTATNKALPRQCWKKIIFSFTHTGFITITLTCIVTIDILSPAGMSLHYDFLLYRSFFSCMSQQDSKTSKSPVCAQTHTHTHTGITTSMMAIIWHESG